MPHEIRIAKDKKRRERRLVKIEYQSRAQIMKLAKQVSPKKATPRTRLVEEIRAKELSIYMD